MATVEIRSIQTGAIVTRELTPWEAGCKAHWHPSGRFLCICHGDQAQTRIYRFDAATGKLEYQRTIECGHGDTNLTFNRSGDRFYATGWGRSVSLWDFYTGLQIFETRISVAPRVMLALHSEMNQLALFADTENPGDVGVCSVADGREYRALAPLQKERKPSAGHFAVHPDGRVAAQSFSDGLRLFDLERGAELAFTENKEQDRNVSFRPWIGHLRRLHQ